MVSVREWKHDTPLHSHSCLGSLLPDNQYTLCSDQYVRFVYSPLNSCNSFLHQKTLNRLGNFCHFEYYSDIHTCWLFDLGHLWDILIAAVYRVWIFLLNITLILHNMSSIPCWLEMWTCWILLWWSMWGMWEG